MADRPTIEVATPAGGWMSPWPNVAELEAALPHDKWTLVGGLMVQLHCFHRGIGALRPTSDIDILLHIETARGLAAEAMSALESIGYELTKSIDQRRRAAHRFTRGHDVVDVLIADHASPKVIERMRGMKMVPIDGGTQALRRTLNARLKIGHDKTTTLSVPSPFGAVILKAAAFVADPRDKQRHIQDAAMLLAAIDDPFAERTSFRGSDAARLRTLAKALPDDALAWRLLPEASRTDGQAALRILTAARTHRDGA